MRTVPDDRGGFALVLVLLALMVLAGIASAALAAGLGQLRAAGRAGRVLAGQTVATASVAEAIGGMRGQPVTLVGGPAVEVLRDTIEDGGSRRVLDLRIAPEFHLLMGEAWWDGGVAMRHARVVWWLDPEERTGGHRAVLEAETVVVAPGSAVRTDLILRARPGVPGCSRSPALARSFARPGPLVHGALPQPPEWGRAAMLRTSVRSDLDGSGRRCWKRWLIRVSPETVGWLLRAPAAGRAWCTGVALRICFKRAREYWWSTVT